MYRTLPRQDRTNEQKVLLERPGCPVTVTYPTEENHRLTTFCIPERSKWRAGAHWHERYTELFRVVRGRVKLIKDDVSTIVTSEDGEQRVPKFCVHEFMRADIDTQDEHGSGEDIEGDVIVEEWVDPADGLKELFFRNLFGSIQDRMVLGRLLDFQIILTSKHFDNYDVFVHGKFHWLFTHLIYAVGGSIARLFGLRAHYPEYTPSRLASLVEVNGKSTKKL